MSNDCCLEDCFIKNHNCYSDKKCRQIRDISNLKEVCNILNIKYQSNRDKNIINIKNKLELEIDNYQKVKSEYIICHSNFVAESNHIISNNLLDNSHNNNLSLNVFKNLKELSNMVNKI